MFKLTLQDILHKRDYFCIIKYMWSFFTSNSMKVKAKFIAVIQLIKSQNV